jgi:hypothetical protein
VESPDFHRDKLQIANEEQLIKLVTGETDEPIKTPPSAAPVRYIS